MDRGRGPLRLARFATRAGATFAILALASCAGRPADLSAVETSGLSGAVAGDLMNDGLVELRWIAAGVDPVEPLSMRPATCQTAAADERVAASRRLGEIAFESPALLGGAAARMGLSCAACHPNGRSNSSFFIAGVSGEPGTADITSSLLSKTRGDGVFNPVRIPDLAARDGSQMRDRASEAFRDKMRALIVEEFDAQPPDEAVFDGVIAYLDSLDASACTAMETSEPVRARRDFDLARAASGGPATGLEAAAAAPADTGVFLRRTARFSLQRLSQRYVAADHLDVRARLEDISRRLGQEADALRAGRSSGRLVADAEWDRLAALLDAHEAGSLYDAATLRAALNGAGP